MLKYTQTWTIQKTLASHLEAQLDSLVKGSLKLKRIRPPLYRQGSLCTALGGIVKDGDRELE